MGLSNVAKNALATAAFSGTLPITDWDAAASHIGVGDSATAYLASQTDLQASTNKLRKAMDAGFPTDNTTGVLVYRATYGLTEANWAWNEWGVFNAASSGSMLNRCVQSLGTKPDTEIWQVAGTLTFTAA